MKLRLFVRICGIIALLILAVWLYAMSGYLGLGTQYVFEKHGCWGKSPQELAKIIETTDSQAQIFAALNALALIDIHYLGDADTLRDVLKVFDSTFQLASTSWGDEEVQPSQANYSPINPLLERHALHWTRGELTKAGVYCYLADFVAGPCKRGTSWKKTDRDKIRPIVEEWKHCFDSMRPAEGTTLYEIWREQRSEFDSEQ